MSLKPVLDPTRKMRHDFMKRDAYAAEPIDPPFYALPPPFIELPPLKISAEPPPLKAEK